MADFEVGPLSIDVSGGLLKLSAGYEEEGLGRAGLVVELKAADIIEKIVADSDNEVDDIVAAPIIAMLRAAE
jgi:hypothetical protein